MVNDLVDPMAVTALGTKFARAMRLLVRRAAEIIVVLVVSVVSVVWSSGVYVDVD